MPYDSCANPSRIVDELGRETLLTFDLLDRLVAWIAPDPDDVGTSNGLLLPPAVKYDYDPFDNVLAVEQINHRPAIGGEPAAVTSHVTTFAYDGMDGTTYTFDAMDELRAPLCPAPHASRRL